MQQVMLLEGFLRFELFPAEVTTFLFVLRVLHDKVSFETDLFCERLFANRTPKHFRFRMKPKMR